MKKSLLFLLLFFSLSSISSLSAATVKGKIVDSHHDPLDFVNVVLQPTDKSLSIKGGVSDVDGEFKITDVAVGNYKVEITFVGYSTYTKEIALTSFSQVLDLGQIVLKEDATMLGEVEVTGQASQMRFDIDKKVFNVDQSLASSGASASEMLANIPSVEVDNEGNVSLRNNSSVEVWINGKPSGLDADNRAQILEQMPAGTIESVEIITNPSAKYSPEGTAGIINLVLKKDRKAGYYGSVQAGIVYPWGAKAPGGNFSANVNYNSSLIDAYANLGVRYMGMNGSGYTDRYTFAPNTSQLDTLSHLYQTSDEFRQFGGIFARAGLDWHINIKNTLGVSFVGNWGLNKSTSTIDYDILQMLDNNNQKYRRDNTSTGGRNTYSVTLEYLYEIDKKGSEWRSSLTYNNNTRRADENYDQIVLAGNNEEYRQFQSNNSNNKQLEFKSDYVQKFSDNMKLEAGLYGSWRDRFSPSRAYDLSYTSTDSTLVQYNDFKYQEYIGGLYATYGAKFGNFSFQAGLRGEYTNTLVQTRDAATDNYTDNRRGYFELFPTAYISYALPKNNELQLNYTRRINRPRGRMLNGFRDLSDSTNIVFGNPLLQPEFATAVELNYIKTWDEHALSGSLYYRYMDNVIQSVSFIAADGVMNQTYENIAKQQTAGLELVAKNKITRWFNLTTTLNLYYSKMNDVFYDTDLDGYVDLLTPETSSLSWSARLMGNFMFGNGFTGQVSGRYSSPRVIAQGESKANYSIDLGLRKSFLQRKLTVSLSARGLLQSHGWRTITYSDTFWQDVERQGHGAMIGLSVSYNFGNMRQTGKRDKTDAQSDFGGDEMDMGE